MADSDKNIVITPNIGQTSDPSIVFTGGDNNPVTLTVLDPGTLSFDGSSGQLFSITDSLSGTIFSVNDISGIPSFEVDDDGTIRLAEFAGNVLIGTATDDGSNKLQLTGDAKITGNFETTGNVTVGGTVDGRDVAADGSKLDGIESGATANQTASEILTAIKTVDGSGSGLDADLLDGQQATKFVRDAGSGPTDLDDAGMGVWRINAGHTNQPGGSATNYGTLVSFDNLSDTGFQVAVSYSSASMYFRGGNDSVYGGSGSFQSWAKVWNDLNDGSGSGLDADLLDGQQGSYYYSPANAPDPTLTLAGDASGSATFTNLGNATLSVTVADDSHNHSSSSGNFTVNGNLIVGSASDADANVIEFAGTTGDTAAMTYIGERIYGSTEWSELLLFKGNDIAGASGPDRIRTFSNQFVVDVYSAVTAGTFDQVGASGNAIRALTIDQTTKSTFSGEVEAASFKTSNWTIDQDTNGDLTFTYA